MWNRVRLSIIPSGTTRRITSCMTASWRSLLETLSLCCVETTTQSRRAGRPFAYSTVTCVLPSRWSMQTVARRAWIAWTVCILHRDLRFAVRPQKVDYARLARLCQAAGKFVSEQDGQRHQFFGLVAGEAKHQALVTGTASVYTSGDIGGLALDGGDHATGIGVKAVLALDVAQLTDGFADDVGILDMRRGGDLAGQNRQAGGHQRLTSHAARRVLGQHGVQH